MKGDPKVIETLMAAASMEAALVMQYILDRRDLRFQGLDHLASKIGGFSKDSRGYLDEITERVLYLGGDPEYGAAESTIAATITEMFQRALDAETALVAFYNDAAIEAMNAKDDNTRNKFEHWIKYHEDSQIDWLSRQLAQISSMSEAEYVKVQLSRS
jgi:bacterioferritin